MKTPTKEQKSRWNKAYYSRNVAKMRARSRVNWVLRAQFAMERKYPPTRPKPSVCECCGLPPTEWSRKLCLDHDHLLDTFRGWLCRKCNLALGSLDDDPERIKSLYKYLTRQELM